MNIKLSILLTFFFAAFISLPGRSFAQVYGWSSPGGGTNGEVNTIVVYNNNIVVGGSFSMAGSTSANNIALWNGSTWQVLGSPVNGVNDTVYALFINNGDLIAGGKFTTAGGISANGIARWNGSSWYALGSGINGEAEALNVFNGMLIAGGNFNNVGSNIAGWNGSSWVQLGSGVNDDVYALTVNSGNLFAAGKFTIAGGITANRIARWNGSVWDSLGSGTNERIYALTVYNSNLIAGGRFTQAGGNTANYIASWNGSAWSSLPISLDDAVYALGFYNNQLIVGGQFRNAGSLFVNRICYWDGNLWSRMVTGMNNKVNTITIKDTLLFAGGSFTSAGGDFANYVAQWGHQTTHTISGQVRYADNNQPVVVGKVKAVRMDISTREVIVVDSAAVTNGDFIIPNVPLDSMFIISFPSDELQNDFVPTYHPSTIDWMSAVKVYPSGNLTNVNINVFRVTPGPSNPLIQHISGYVYLNYTPPFMQSGYPYFADAIIYAKQGSNYRKFSVSDPYEYYTLDSLPSGTYDIFVNRLGYTSAQETINLGGSNLDSVNFYLDTVNHVIGIRNIGVTEPSRFELAQNYPNPFNPSTKIRFTIARNSFVEITVFDILGREIEKLVSGNFKAGVYELTYNAFNRPSGVYFYRLNSDNFTETKKMILIK